MMVTDQVDLVQAKKLFCIFVARGFEPEEAAVRSGIPINGDPARTACLLLGEYGLRRRIARLTKALAFCAPAARARSGLERLALGAGYGREEVQLADGADPLPPDLLFHLAEVKYPKGGGVELKFFDRLKALSLLAGLEGEGGEAESPLLDALSRSANALAGPKGEQGRED